MPRSEAANQRVREAQRARILAGARTVLASRGLAATMADVAAAAGVSQGLAYRYFTGKDELVRELVAEAMRAAPPSFRDLEVAATPGQRLERFLAVLVEARRTQREFFQLVHHVASDPETPPDLLLQMRGRGQMFARALRAMIVEAQATGEVAGDEPDQLVAAVIAYLDGLARLALSHPDGAAAAFPAPDIIFRLLRPPARRKSQDREGEGECA